MNYLITEDDIKEIKLNIKNAFAGVKFKKETHTYTYNGYILESSSAYRKEFENEFEIHFSAESKYKSNLKKNINTKLTPAYYRERWDLLGQEARVRGTRVHLYSETYPELEEPSCSKEKGVHEFFTSLDSKYEVLFQELIMFDSEYYKAGTADMIILNKETGNIIIGDWKTNDKSIFECYNKKKLKGEFSRHYDTSYNKYSMQLSHYKLMIEKFTGYKVEDMWLIWLTTSSKKKEDKRYKYQKVNALNKGKYYRCFSCKDVTEILQSSFVKRKDYIIKNLKEESYYDSKSQIEDLEQLEDELPKLPMLPQLRYIKESDDQPNKKFKLNNKYKK